MSYRIDYGPRIRRRVEAEHIPSRVPVLTLGFFGLFALLLHLFWPQGRQVFARLLFGQGGAAIARCTSDVLRALQEGEPVYDAAVAALRDVVHGY